MPCNPSSISAVASNYVTLANSVKKFRVLDGLKMTAVAEASSRRTGNKAGWASTDKLELFPTSLC